MIGSQRRIEYIDKLKGFAIVLVVMGHITQFSMGIDNILFNRLYGSIHVPLFFFLSGYFAGLNDKKPLLVIIKNKGVQLIMPTIWWGGAWLLFKGEGNLNALNAYWFLPVLFYCLVFSRIIQARVKNTAILLIIGCIGFVGLIILYKLNLGVLPFYLHFVMNYPLFLFGMVFEQYKEKFSKNIIYTLSMVAFIVLIGLNIQIINKLKLSGFFACIIFYDIFKKYNDYIPKWLGILGKNSTEIYVTHYFLLPNLLLEKSVKFLENTNVIQLNNISILAVVTIALSVLLCFEAVLISKMVKESDFFAFVCYGKIKRLNK